MVKLIKFEAIWCILADYSVYSAHVKIAPFVAKKRAIFNFFKVATDLILSPLWRQIAPSGHPAQILHMKKSKKYTSNKVK